LFDHFFVAAGGFFVPLPGVFEGGDLGGGAGAVRDTLKFAYFSIEEDVVVLTGVEGRVEVDEVDGLVGDVVAEDFEVVAVVAAPGWCTRHHDTSLDRAFSPRRWWG
jgi:hypothetical protein